MLTIALGVEGLIFVKHNGMHMTQTDYLEADLHSLLGYMFIISVIVVILECAIVDESLIIFALLRCTCFVWLGVWLVHMAFTLYKDYGQLGARIDNILLKPDPKQEMIDLLICIGYLVMSMIIVATQALAGYLSLKLGQLDKWKLV